MCFRNVFHRIFEKILLFFYRFPVGKREILPVGDKCYTSRWFFRHKTIFQNRGKKIFPQIVLGFCMDSSTTFPHDRDCHTKENLLVAQGNFRYDIKFSTKSTGSMSITFKFMLCIVLVPGEFSGFCDLASRAGFWVCAPRMGMFELNARRSADNLL